MKYLSYLVFIVLLGCVDSSNDYFFQKTKMLQEDEKAGVYTSISGPFLEENKIQSLVLDAALIRCINTAERVWDPGAFDRYILLRTAESKLFLEFRFYEKELQYIAIWEKQKGKASLQIPTAKVYRMKCDPKNWFDIENIYTLPKGWK